VTLAFPEGLPELAPPNGVTEITIALGSDANQVTFDDVTLWTAIDDGSFEAAAMASVGAGVYVGALPVADCGAVVSYFVTAQMDIGLALREPPSGSYQAIVGESVREVFTDDFEAPVGYSVSGDAQDGQWEVGTPVDCDRGDPPADFDGSGQCWLTDNDLSGCNSDVDDGVTVLTTPVLDLGGEAGIAFVRYARWFSNTAGANPNDDVFEVEISNDDGVNWVGLEVVGPGGLEADGGWVAVRRRVELAVEPSDAVRLRFIASDFADSGSVVEAGVDALGVDLVVCSVDGVAPEIVHDAGASTRPFSGYIDSKQESTDGRNVDLGVTELTILFSEAVRDVDSGSGGGLTAKSFGAESDDGGLAVVAVDAVDNPVVRLTLSGPIPVGHWTTIVADVEDFAGNRIENLGDLGVDRDEPDRVDIGYLPCDVDQSGGVQPLDLLRFRQALNGLVRPDIGTLEDFFDFDRDGVLQVVDLLRFRQHFLGTATATQPWQGAVLGERP
jgi:hypothetical protein